VLEDYQKNAVYHESRSAAQNGQVYAQLPYNYYKTNISTATADAYYLGKVRYPATFVDIGTAQQAHEIYKALIGQPVCDQMCAAFDEFCQLKLGNK
jgi:iron complex transport system substrate-binding protein